jgi:hypothetical protein
MAGMIRHSTSMVQNPAADIQSDQAEEPGAGDEPAPGFRPSGRAGTMVAAKAMW